MTRLKKHVLALAVLSAMSAAGCGTGSNSPSATTSRTGVITGFGSVFVNGVEYDTDHSTVAIEGAGGSESDLAIGMLVTLEGSVNADGTTGVAAHISYSDDLEGIVSAVNIAADGTGTLTVMGQTVKVDATTTFESKVATITAMNLIVKNSVVEVSGYTAGTGDIVATRVEVKKAEWQVGDEIELKGVIAGLDETAKTFMLGMLKVDYSAAKVEHTLANGLYVEVKSTTAPNADNVLTATKVEVEGDGKKGVDGDAGDEFELEGVVSTVISATEFVLNGQTVLIVAGTEFKNGIVDAIVVDAKLEVEGTLNADGKLVADEIKFRHESSIEIKAAVEAIDTTAGTIKVLGQTVLVNSLTTMIDEICTASWPSTCSPAHDFSLSKLVVGAQVKLHVAIVNGTLVATKLETSDSKDVELEGPVTAISGTGTSTQVTIAGVTVALGTLLDMTKVIANVTTLEIKGTYADNVLTATEAEIKK